MDAQKKEIAVTRAIENITSEPLIKNAQPQYYGARESLIKNFKSNESRKDLLAVFGLFMNSAAAKNSIHLDTDTDQSTYDIYAQKVINLVAGITPSMLPKFAQASNAQFTFQLPPDSDGFNKTAEVLSWLNDLINSKLILTFGVRYFDPNNSGIEVLTKYKVVDLKADNTQEHTVSEINSLLTMLGMSTITTQEETDWGWSGPMGEYDIYNLLEAKGKFSIHELYAIGVGIAISKGGL